MKTILAHRSILVAVALAAAACQNLPGTEGTPQPAAPQITEDTLRQRAQGQLADGVKQYDAGDYDNAVKTLSASLDTMEKNLGMAADGTGRAQKAIAALNLSAKKMLDLPLEQQLSIIADRFTKIASPAKQTQIAMQLFGDSGAQLLPILQRGAQGIKELRDEADRLGFTLTSEGAGKLKESEEAMIRVKASTTALSSELTIALAPAIETVERKSVKSLAVGSAGFGKDVFRLGFDGGSRDCAERLCDT